jgi:hypothetical protein
MKKHELPALSGDDNTVDGYEYLLRMRMDRVKASAVTEAEKELEKAKQAYEELMGSTASQLWLKDLDEFEAAWEKMKQVREEACSSADQVVRAKKPMKKK